MIIKELKLEHFRNYAAEEISFTKGINVFYGDNAQGKTNLIEALYVLSVGKSFRTIYDKELITFHENFLNISCKFDAFGRQQEHCIFIEKPRNKRIRINGLLLKNRSEFIGKLQVVLFTPQDLTLIKDGPHQRRKFIDLSISQLSPRYLYTLSQYHKVLAQKARLLKDLKFKPSLVDTLDIWNEKLSELAAIMMWYRRDFLEKLQRYAAKIHKEISNETLLMKYESSVEVKDNDSIELLKERFLKRLNIGKEKEISTASCLYGPHREDISLFINGKNLKIYGSQGQQRTGVLSLKMAQLDIIKEDTGEYPVLLLDDVTSELDKNRREYLFNKISGKQVFITCTDTDRINIHDNIDFFNIIQGKIEREL